MAAETSGPLRLFNWLLKIVNKKGIEKTGRNLAAHFEDRAGSGHV